MFLLCLITLVSGFISPKLVLWIWGERNKTRKEVLRYFGTTSFVLFVIYSIFTFKEPGSEPMKEIVDAVQQVDNQNDIVEGKIWDFLRKWNELYTPGWWNTITDIEVSGSEIIVRTNMYYGKSFSGTLDSDAIEPAESICRVILLNEPFDDMGIRSIDVQGRGDRIITWCRREDKMHSIEIQHGKGGM
jgi:hypothetical protein